MTDVFLIGLLGGFVIGASFAVLQEFRCRNLERAIDLLLEKYGNEDEEFHKPEDKGD